MNDRDSSGLWEAFSSQSIPAGQSPHVATMFIGRLGSGTALSVGPFQSPCWLRITVSSGVRISIDGLDKESARPIFWHPHFKGDERIMLGYLTVRQDSLVLFDSAQQGATAFPPSIEEVSEGEAHRRWLAATILAEYPLLAVAPPSKQSAALTRILSSLPNQEQAEIQSVINAFSLLGQSLFAALLHAAHHQGNLAEVIHLLAIQKREHWNAVPSATRGQLLTTDDLRAVQELCQTAGLVLPEPFPAMQPFSLLALP